ncbi:hypothetical protein, partial [Streptomyces silvensis]|uniref:hypothetical protein n=1 Tax=Streptomyces silvensis TaxID=1765722 RepID=UPI0018E2FF47
LSAVVDHHDMLRSRLVTGPETGIEVTAPGTVDVASLIHRVSWTGSNGSTDATDHWDTGWRERATAELDAATDRLDAEAGVMAQFVWFDAGTA